MTNQFLRLSSSESRHKRRLLQQESRPLVLTAALLGLCVRREANPPGLRMLSLSPASWPS